jgi:hypothetical protein
MSETNLYQYTEQEKLNKMQVDLIDVDITLPSGNTADGDVLFHPQKIENAVPENGGHCMIQSVALIVQDNATEGSADGTVIQTISLWFTSNKSNTNFSAALDLVNASTVATSTMDEFLGQVYVTNLTDVGRQSIGGAQNIGIVGQSGTGRDLYVWGLAHGVDNYNGGTLKLRVGVIKD